jgi:bifunctional UDP-N-acetylglucosamine pyrophosphorylase/glucosamine-1-phosphate N-acetyltransferase
LDDPGKYGRMLVTKPAWYAGLWSIRTLPMSSAPSRNGILASIASGPVIMFMALSKISNQNQQGEYYLTDTLSILRSEGKTIESIPLEHHIEVSGVNSQQQLAELEEASSIPSGRTGSTTEW